MENNMNVAMATENNMNKEGNEMFDRVEVVNEMIDLLGQYEYVDGFSYKATERGCNRIIDNMIAKKSPLFSVLSKHPNYNGKCQIVLNETFHRETDPQAIEAFVNYLYRCSEPDSRRYVHSLKRGDTVLYSYYGEMVRCVVGSVDHSDNTVRIVDEKYFGTYGNWVRVNGLKYEDGTCVAKENDGFFYSDVRHIADLIWNTAQYIDEIHASLINTAFPWLRAHVGQKKSRVVKKICDKFGVSKRDDWNREFPKFCDAINPLDVTRWTIISWHPIDYLTMSFGNSWASCHTIDKTNKRGMPNDYSGMYSGGTLSYMGDPSSVIVYVVDRAYNGNHFELEPKIMRQMFHIAEDGTSFVQGRLYPQDNDCGATDTYDKLRAIMQKIIADCFGTPNYWDVKKGTDPCRSAIVSRGVHYRDYIYYGNVTFSSLREGYTGAKIEVGSNPICPTCGSIHRNEDCILCDECRSEGERRCDECGCIIDDESIEVDGHIYCCASCAEGAGYRWCEDVCEWHSEDDDIVYDDWCDAWIYAYDEIIETVNGRTFSCRENAESAGYRYVESEGEWYRRSMVTRDVETGEYVLV